MLHCDFYNFMVFVLIETMNIIVRISLHKKFKAKNKILINHRHHFDSV